MNIALECKSKHVTNEKVWLSKVELIIERETTKDSSVSYQKKKGTSVSCNFWKLRKMDQPFLYLIYQH